MSGAGEWLPDVRGRQRWAVWWGAAGNSRVLGAWLSLMTSYADADGVAFPLRKTQARILYGLEDDAEVSKGTLANLDKVIAQAESLGVVETVERYRESGQRMGNLYFLSFPDLGIRESVDSTDIPDAGYAEDVSPPVGSTGSTPVQMTEATPVESTETYKENRLKKSIEKDTTSPTASSSPNPMGASPHAPNLSGPNFYQQSREEERQRAKLELIAAESELAALVEPPAVMQDGYELLTEEGMEYKRLRKELSRLIAELRQQVR